MSLANDYRPNKFKKIVGNDHIKDDMIKKLKKKKFPDAVMMIGSPGCGKTTFARVIKHELECSDSDYVELNAADDRGIEAVRGIREGLKFAPLEGKVKVIHLDEAHMITPAAQESLLKLLEEPPSYVHLVVSTTNPEKLKPTFKRRCNVYHVDKLSRDEILTLVKKVYKKEGVKKHSAKVLDRLEEMADGSAGIALKLLEQIIDVETQDDETAIRLLKSAGSSLSEVVDICKALTDMNISNEAKWNRCKKLLLDFKKGGDAEGARYQILGWISGCLLKWKLNSKDQLRMVQMIECFSETMMYGGHALLAKSVYYAIYGY